MKNLKYIAPDYPRIPHLSAEISRLGVDDFVEEAVFPLDGFVQEKVDAANMGALNINLLDIILMIISRYFFDVDSLTYF